MRRFSYLCLAVAISAGCGSVKTGQLPDGPPSIDASTDAPPPVDAAPGIDAPPAPTSGIVKVTVLDPGGAGTPAVGATVLFINPDDTLVKRAATDAAGKADAEVMPGASVTSIVVVGTSYQLQTVLAVKPGDDIVIGTKTNDTTSAGMMTVTFPVIQGATFYEVSGPCFGNQITPPVGVATASVTLFFQTYCKVDPMEIVVSAQDPNFAVVQSVHKTGVAFVDGGTITIPSYEGTRSFTGSFTNINPVIGNLDLSRSVPDGFGISTSKAMASPPTTLSLSLTGETASSARVDTSVSIASGSVQRVRQSLGGTAVTYGLDVGATLLPWLSKPPTFDLAAGKVLVTTDTTGTTMDKPDAFRVVATYRRSDPATGATTSFNWTLYAAAPGDLKLPTLPAEVGPLAPLATDSISPLNAQMFEADTVAGYDAVRNDLGAAFLLYGGNRPPAATIRISTTPLLRR